MSQFNPSDIETFYKRFNQLPEYYKLEKVHQLIQNPEAKAMLRIKLKFKPLKFIIMASIPIMLLAALIIWPGKNIENTSVIDASRAEFTENESIKQKEQPKVEIMITENNKKPSVPQGFIEKPTPILIDSTVIDSTSDTKAGEINSDKTCTWPEDTLIDKHSLFIYLSQAEILKLGVHLYKDSMSYRNEFPGGGYVVSDYNMHSDPGKSTHYKFYQEDNSDTSCTKHRWGHPFYNEIDTLLPVVIHIMDEVKILWFTPHPDIFVALPERYSYLENIYSELKCLKKKHSERQYVNYWNKERNKVLDEINYLELDKRELGEIGIDICKDSISIIDETQSFKYMITDRKLDVGTWYIEGQTGPPEIPNMFPTLITDIKGLKQNMFGNWMKNKDNPLSAFNTLIPVYMPFSDYIKNRNYQLIFWYYPTEDFLNALPERYRKTLRTEIEYISTGQANDEVNCTYFEACKSTLQLENLKVYPNPASFSTTIEFSSDKLIIGSISLVNISGAMIKQLIDRTDFQKGKNRFDLNLSGITPGVYLVYILTDEGFKTQRLIISK